MRRCHHRRIPVCAVFQVFRLLSENVLGIGFYRASTLIDVVIFGQSAINRGCVNEPWVFGVESNVCALATAHWEVVLVPNTAAERPAGNGHRGVVLLASIQSEGYLVVGNDPIKLSGGLIHDAGP